MFRKAVSIVLMCFIIASCVRKSAEVRVYLNENQCLYSYSNLVALNDLPPDFSLVLYASKHSFATWDELFEQLSITKPYRFEACGDTIRENIVEIYQNKVKRLSCKIEALPNVIPHIRTLNSKLMVRDSVPLDGSTLSSRNFIDVQDSLIVFSDYLLNSAHIVNYNNKTIQKIKGADFDTKDFLALVEYDEDVYEKILPELEKHNLHKVSIASLFIRNDTISIVSTIDIPVPNGENTDLLPQFFIGNYFGGKWVNLYNVNFSIQAEEIEYGIFNKVYRFNNTFITNLITPNLAEQNHLWAQFKPINEQLTVDVLQYLNPKIVVPKQVYPYSLMGVHSDWLFLQYFPIAFHPKTNKIIDYRHHLQEVDFKEPVSFSNNKLFFVDFFCTNSLASVIYNFNGDYHFMQFDMHNDVLVFSRKLVLPENIDKSSLRMLQNNKFSVMPDHRKSIHILSY